MSTPRLTLPGKIVLTSRDGRDADLSLTLTANNEGGGTLNLGSYSVTQEGRYAMEITALDGGSGNLTIRQNNYGADSGFILSQSANHLGIVDAQYDGVDVAGNDQRRHRNGKGTATHRCQ